MEENVARIVIFRTGARLVLEHRGSYQARLLWHEQKNMLTALITSFAEKAYRNCFGFDGKHSINNTMTRT